MPVAKFRHKMTTSSGKPVFLVRTPLPVNRRLLGRVFIDGQTHTTNEDLAKRFCEEFEYEVVLPEGHKGFKFAKSAELALGVNPSAEDSILLDDEDGDGNGTLPDDD